MTKVHVNFFRQTCSIHQLRKSQEESRQLDHWFEMVSILMTCGQKRPLVPIELRALDLIVQPLDGESLIGTQFFGTFYTLKIPLKVFQGIKCAKKLCSY